MKEKYLFLIYIVSLFLILISCGSSYYVPNRPYGYSPDFTRTYTDKSVYRPAHYRNFVNENSRYLNDPSRNVTARNRGQGQRVDENYKANTYVDTHAKTGKPLYHTTYTTSYNDNGEVTTTYTTDYVGTKKEVQYWEEVRKEQKKAYDESRKKKKMRVKDFDE